MPVKASLMLTHIRSRFNALTLEQAQNTNNQIMQLLEQAKNIRKKLPDEPLRDAFMFTEYWMLIELNRREEALELAKTINSPDAEVFIDLHK